MREIYRKYRGYIKLFLIFTLIVFAFIRADDVLRLLGVASGIVSPIIAGACVAFVLNLPMRRLEKLYDLIFKRPGAKRARRAVCLTLTVLLAALFAFVVIYMLVPELTRAIGIVVGYVPGALQDARGFISALNIEWLSALIPESETVLTSEEVSKWVADAGQFLLSGIVNTDGIIRGFAGVAQSVWGGVLALLFSLYMLAGKERIVSQMMRLCRAYLKPDHSDDVIALARQTGGAFSGFISGQFLSALILGAIVLVFMLAAGLPYAPLISLISAVFALIPIFGAMIGCVLGALILLMTSPTQALWFFIVHVVIQQVSGNLIYPRVVGKSIGLPPLYMLVASTIGGSLMGVVGMLVFVPIMAVVYARLRDSTARRMTAEQAAAIENETKPEPPEPEKPKE